jgi:hypothetical protein
MELEDLIFLGACSLLQGVVLDRHADPKKVSAVRTLAVEEAKRVWDEVLKQR